MHFLALLPKDHLKSSKMGWWSLVKLNPLVNVCICLCVELYFRDISGFRSTSNQLRCPSVCRWNRKTSFPSVCLKCRSTGAMPPITLPTKRRTFMCFTLVADLSPFFTVRTPPSFSFQSSSVTQKERKKKKPPHQVQPPPRKENRAC